MLFAGAALIGPAICNSKDRTGGGGCCNCGRRRSGSRYARFAIGKAVDHDCWSPEGVSQ